MSNTSHHRDPDKVYVDYYVNGTLQFSFWQDESHKTKEDVLSALLNSSNWKFMAWYCDWKLQEDKTKVSDDLLKVELFVIEGKGKGKA